MSQGHEKRSLVLVSIVSGRATRVKLEHITSEPKPIKHSVPEGSVLGPVLFYLLEKL